MRREVNYRTEDVEKEDLGYRDDLLLFLFICIEIPQNILSYSTLLSIFLIYDFLQNRQNYWLKLTRLKK